MVFPLKIQNSCHNTCFRGLCNCEVCQTSKIYRRITSNVYIYIYTSEFLDIPALYNYIGFGKFWGAVARLHLPCFQTWWQKSNVGDINQSFSLTLSKVCLGNIFQNSWSQPEQHALWVFAHIKLPSFIRTFLALMRDNPYAFVQLRACSPNFFIRLLHLSEAFYKSPSCLPFLTLVYHDVRL